MRPRRRILVYCANESTLATTVYMLNVRGYAAVGEPDANEVSHVLMGGHGFDALLILAMRKYATSHALSGFAIERVPVLYVDRNHPHPNPPCTRVLGKGQAGNDQILEALRLLVIRKRGPKPNVAAIEKRAASA